MKSREFFFFLKIKEKFQRQRESKVSAMKCTRNYYKNREQAWARKNASRLAARISLQAVLFSPWTKVQRTDEHGWMRMKIWSHSFSLMIAFRTRLQGLVYGCWVRVTSAYVALICPINTGDHWHTICRIIKIGQAEMLLCCTNFYKNKILYSDINTKRGVGFATSQIG